jgi:predicted Zn-dependent protease
MHRDFAQRLIEAGQLERAREELRLALTVDSSFPEIEDTRAEILGLDGQFDSALDVVSRYESRSGVSDAALRGYLLARAGRTVEATAILRELEREAKRERRLLSTDRARVLLGLGKPDSAIGLLSAGVEQHDAWELYSSWSQTIRSDPRFQAVLRRAGVAR